MAYSDGVTVLKLLQFSPEPDQMVAVCTATCSVTALQ